MMIPSRMHRWQKYELKVMGLFDRLFGKKELKKQVQSKREPLQTAGYSQSTIPTDKLMTSQFPALYLKDNNQAYYDTYIRQLMRIGFNEKNAKTTFFPTVPQKQGGYS